MENLTVKERSLRLFSLGKLLSPLESYMYFSNIFLDGGIRGLAELCILGEIMNRLQGELKLDHEPTPTDYFDLMGGTSTGG